ncbi:MAG: hypothetical protein IJU49_03900, partial [Lachnospiraceae bacterium]|nr:hypothetical protein [Lachnospiraceae bacterium]
VELVGEAAEEKNEAVAAMLSDAQDKLAEAARVAEITEAYEAEDYEKVVELVGEAAEEKNEAVAAMLTDAQDKLAEAARVAEITEAYETENYQKVVELVGKGGKEETEEILEMRKVAVVHVAQDMIRATGDDQYIQLPSEGSILSEFKTMYVDQLPYDWCTATRIEDPVEAEANQKACGPSVPVERVPEARSGRLQMPWAYSGSKVTVLAEENEMSCIVYLSSENEERAGWVQSRFLVDTFPGRSLSVGNSDYANTRTVNGITLQWSRKGFLDSQQNYSVLSETVENCVGFTLEYQLIAENTLSWNSIYGPRTIYVNNGSEWIRVGSFDYPESGTAVVTVSLDEPTDITAIGTIAEVGLPNTFFFRQNATDFQVIDG